jgi:HK97 family phage prohead protease
MIDTITKNFGAKIKKTDNDREIIARVTTATVDMEGDVILAGGIDLSAFKGTMLLNHDNTQLPIGKWLGAEKKGNGIIMHGQLARRPPEHPQMVEWVPDTVKWLIQEDVLNSVSVGFRIKDSRPASTKDTDRYGTAVQRVINEWQLLEVSIVPIGANPEAIVTAIGKSAMQDSVLCKLWGVAKKTRKLSFDLNKRRVISFNSK